MHAIWKTIRRPFRYPSCVKCVWEVYDVNAAGCLKCGANHVCYSNAVDNCCPLETCDDHSRVCTITGQVLREVRHAQNEFLDTAIMTREDETSNSGASSFDIEAEVHSTVYKLLQGELAIKYRDEENTRQAKKIATTLHKALRQAKMRGLDGLPNVCTFVAEVMNAERNIRFIQEASDDLAEQCTKRIIVCLMNLKGKGVKITSGARIQSLTCGLLYLLRTGLVYGNSILIASIGEISACIPHENKLEAYFGISSKVICETENEIKLVFREHYQK